MKKSKPMDPIETFPDAPIDGAGAISLEFTRRGVTGFSDACRYVHQMPYGYNKDRDDIMILFKEGFGTCTTKHAVIATLARELNLSVVKKIGIYAMTEEIVTGTNDILGQDNLPYVPMVHCFLAMEEKRVDLTAGNHNGKNCHIDDFLFTQEVLPNISAKEEYLLYRNALKDHILLREELRGVPLKHLLQAREAGIKLLRSKV
jgi:hypothetical protein